MIFENRVHAGNRLSDEFYGRKLERPIVLGIPCGGVVVASRVAARLACEFDVIVPRMLPIPFNPGAAFGVVTSDGTTVLNDEILWEITLKKEQIEEITQEQLNEAKRLERFYRGSTRKLHLEGRDVMLVDDGTADALALVAASRSIRTQLPAHLCIGTPVISASAAQKVQPEVDEIVAVITSRSWRFSPESYYKELREIDHKTAKLFFLEVAKKKTKKKR